MSYSGAGQLTAGPKTPSAIKKQRGTWRADRDEGKIELPVISTIPFAPDTFTDFQKDVWHTVCHTLFELGLLNYVGLELIKIYCIELKRYHEAEEHIKTYGLMIFETHTKGRDTWEVMKKNPAVEISSNAYAKIISIAGHFGFTPAAATRIKAPGKSDTSIDNEFGF